MKKSLFESRKSEKESRWGWGEKLPFFNKTVLYLCIAMFINIVTYGQNCNINTNVNGNGGAAAAGTGVGQSFTACATGKLNYVQPSAVNTSVATAYVIIYSGEGFTTELGRSGNIQVGSSRTNSFDISSKNIQVTSGQKYTARFMSASGSPLFQYGTYARADYYSGGKVIGAGASNNDMFFSAQILSLGTPTLSPVHNATEVSKTSPIQITFGSTMEAGTGNVVIRNETDAIDLVTIPSEDLIFDGGTVSIDHGLTFEGSKEYSISIASGVLVGTNGVTYTGINATNWSFTVTDRPGLSLSTTESDLTSTSPFQITANFTTAMTGFELADFTATNATLSNFNGSEDSYTVDVTPSSDGVITISVDEDLAADGSSSLNTASNELSLTYDGTFNAPLIESSTPDPTYNALAEVTITVDEAVTGLEEADITLTNASIKSFDITGMVATISIIPTNEGAFGFDITADAFTDLAGNGNAVISYSNTYEIDLTFGMTAYYPISEGKMKDYTGNNVNLDVYRNASTGAAQSGTPTTFEDRYAEATGAMLFNDTDMWTTNLTNGNTAKSFIYNSENGGVSASIWVKPEVDLTSASSGVQTFFETYGGSQDLRLAYYSGGISIKIASLTYNHPVSLFSDQWYHIAFSIVPGGEVTLYMDGAATELSSSAPTSFPESSSDMLMLGSTIVGGYGAVISPANAALEDFMLYNRVLSAVEVELLNENYPKVESLAICDGESLSINGSDYTDADYYLYTKEGTDIDSLIFADLTVYELPKVFASATSVQLCNGETLSLTGHGAESYVWDNDVVDGESFAPTSTTTYTVTGTDENGCTADATVSISITNTALKDVTLSAGQSVFCQTDEDGTTITTSSSVVGFTYYLLNAETGEEVAEPIAGTGAALTFETGELTEDIDLEVYAEEPISGTSGSLEFDGTNDRVTVAFDSASMAISNEFTIESWIYPEGTTLKRIFSNYAGAGNSAVGSILLDLVNSETNVNDGDDLRLYIRKDANTSETISAGDVLTLNAWNHVAVTFKDGVGIIYVDGKLVAADTLTTTSVVYNSSTWGIGEDSGGTNTYAEFFDGKLDEFRVWRYARTQDELQASMGKGLSGSESGLAVYFKFDETIGATTAVDASSNSNDGTLVSMNPATVWSAGLIGSDVSCSRTMEESISLTIGDSEDPEVLVHDISVQLEENGIVTIVPSDIDNGSNDNCTALESLTMSLDVAVFSCSSLGENTVTMNVTDESGNSADATAIVTVNHYIEDRVVTAMDTETCTGGNATISVTNSQTGVNYYLIDNDTNLDVTGPITGSGADITLTAENITTTTNYAVRAVFSNSDHGCELQLDDIVTVTIGDDTSIPNLVLADMSVNLSAKGSTSISLDDILTSVTDNCTQAKSITMSLDQTEFSCSDLGENTVTVTATDESGNTAISTATITVSDQIAPVVITQDLTVNLDEANNITISASDIDNGSYDNCSIASMTLDVTSFTDANLGDNTVVLEVSDAAGNIESATATVKVNPSNQAPVVAVEIGDVTMDEDSDMEISIASYFNDPDGDALTYSATSDVSGVVLSVDSYLLKLSFEADYNGNSTITLTADDGKGGSVSTDFNLIVRPVNDAPVANFTSKTLSAVEGQAFDLDLVLSDIFSDVDGDALTYSVDLSIAYSWLSMEITDTEISFKGSPTYADGNKTATITVSASDRSERTAISFQIAIETVSEAPSDLALSANSVFENRPAGEVVGNIIVTDNDAGDTFTYELSAGGKATKEKEAVAVPFAISGEQIVTTVELDYETQSSYGISLTVTDAVGATYTEDFTISVKNVAEAPTAIILSNSTINENNAINDFIANMTVKDPDSNESHEFTITSNIVGEGGVNPFIISGNQLIANQVFNFEEQSSYDVSILVNDGNGNSYSETFNILVNDIAEAPTAMTLSNSSITENNAIDDFIADITVEDPDLNENHEFTITSKIVGEGEVNPFIINGNQLIANQVFNFEEQSFYDVSILVNDGNGNSYSETFSIEILDANDAPTEIAISANTIEEATAVGTVIATVSALDEDSDDVITYQVEGSLFTIVDEELQLMQAINASLLDSNPVSINITATDLQGASITQTFEITVIEEGNILSAQNPKATIKLYPNPTTTGLNLSDYTKDYSRYEIISLDGQIIEAGMLTQHESSYIPVSGLQSGMYMIRLSGKRVQSYITRFMKQ
ncbi:LamG-like jellyroll fold domain-containing protein [Reichenbachiella agariperforans]|uniref:LamG-like jellyroll fold domain-containing protein n=1 Tax=Reichenbachiella agariperforans TaxID=156994 RepID=UPI001C0835BA|nr:LamG-like jellyroll fold domain-containing protein [Reichenbachiella agariperforans]MBU2914468.1 T9SS type A sorting domain-containing protein [Reichenbachiella agariperforans]